MLLTIDAANVVAKYKDLPNTYSALGDFCSASSAQAPATMLMLQPSNGYSPEVIQFGGFAFTPPGQTCTCDLPAAPRSVRMQLDKANVNLGSNVWTPENMPGRRVGADAVVLPNGTRLLRPGPLCLLTRTMFAQRTAPRLCAMPCNLVRLM